MTKRRVVMLSCATLLASIACGCSEQKKEEQKEPPAAAEPSGGQQGMSGMSGENPAPPAE